MSGIKRYSWGGPAIHGMEVLDDGDYVLHYDHAAENVALELNDYGMKVEVRALYAAPPAQGVELARARVKIAALELQLATYEASAQAVDLGQFRKVVSAVNARLQDVISDNMMPWRERDKASKEQAALYPLLALIDSEVAGK